MSNKKMQYIIFYAVMDVNMNNNSLSNQCITLNRAGTFYETTKGYEIIVFCKIFVIIL